MSKIWVFGYFFSKQVIESFWFFCMMVEGNSTSFGYGAIIGKIVSWRLIKGIKQGLSTFGDFFNRNSSPWCKICLESKILKIRAHIFDFKCSDFGLFFELISCHDFKIICPKFRYSWYTTLQFRCKYLILAILHHLTI